MLLYRDLGIIVDFRPAIRPIIRHRAINHDQYFDFPAISGFSAKYFCSCQLIIGCAARANNQYSGTSHADSGVAAANPRSGNESSE